MRNKTGFLVSLIFLSVYIHSQNLGRRARFISKKQAATMLTTEDMFTSRWSPFDIDSRLQRKGSTKADLLEFIASQTLEWEPSEKETILSLLKSIDVKIRVAGLILPPVKELNFLKTTGVEEGHAVGYTRRNYIVLTEEIRSTSTLQLSQVIVHEIFHLLTRANPEFRRKMYRLIGFKLMKSVPYPHELAKIRLTNPDAPQTDSYITVEAHGEKVDCMMVLYASRPYRGGSFFDYLNVGFMSLEGLDVKQPVMIQGKPVIYSFQELSGFYGQVGRNTQYMIHPEEILADNFASLIMEEKGLEDQWLLDKMKKTLRHREDPGETRE
jgi:hypothetical protein